MQFITKSIDLTFEAIFRTPAFDLALDDGHARALKVFYEKINPRYEMNSSNLHAISSARLSEIKLRMELFNGLGIIELYADKLTASFKNAVGKSDIEIMKDCITLCLDALVAFMPQSQIKEHVFRISTRFELQGKANLAADFIDKLARGSVDIDKDKVNASYVHAGFRREMGNAEKGWYFALDFLRSNAIKEQMIVLFDARYQEGGAYATFKDMADHFGHLIGTVLPAVGLEVKQD